MLFLIAFVWHNCGAEDNANARFNEAHFHILLVMALIYTYL